MRILFVDDDKLTRELIRESISSEVKELYLAENGLDGWIKYLQNCPDIVITDINMPKMGGLELARKIRHLNSFVPILILSAHDEKEMLLEAIDIRVEKYITKPINLFTLLESLKKISEKLLEVRKERELLKKLECRVFMDPVSGVSNRYHFETELQKAIKRVDSEGGRLALLLIDIDNFKNVNDTLGHLAGDNLLRRIACSLSDKLNKNDKVFRIGGDEFAILIEDEDSFKSLDNLGKSLNSACNIDFKYKDKEIKISCSIGGSIYPDCKIEKWQELFEKADNMLYTIKNSGKNGIAINRCK